MSMISGFQKYIGLIRAIFYTKFYFGPYVCGVVLDVVNHEKKFKKI